MKFLTCAPERRSLYIQLAVVGLAEIILLIVAACRLSSGTCTVLEVICLVIVQVVILILLIIVLVRELILRGKRNTQQVTVISTQPTAEKVIEVPAV